MADKHDADSSDSANSTNSTNSSKDLKAEMRAALERKRAKSHPHETGTATDGKVDHAARAANTQRQFRRKSG